MQQAQSTTEGGAKQCANDGSCPDVNQQAHLVGGRSRHQQSVSLHRKPGYELVAATAAPSLARDAVPVRV